MAWTSTVLVCGYDMTAEGDPKTASNQEHPSRHTDDCLRVRSRQDEGKSVKDDY